MASEAPIVKTYQEIAWDILRGEIAQHWIDRVLNYSEPSQLIRLFDGLTTNQGLHPEISANSTQLLDKKSAQAILNALKTYLARFSLSAYQLLFDEEGNFAPALKEAIGEESLTALENQYADHPGELKKLFIKAYVSAHIRDLQTPQEKLSAPMDFFEDLVVDENIEIDENDELNYKKAEYLRQFNTIFNNFFANLTVEETQAYIEAENQTFLTPVCAYLQSESAQNNVDKVLEGKGIGHLNRWFDKSNATDDDNEQSTIYLHPRITFLLNNMTKENAKNTLTAVFTIAYNSLFEAQTNESEIKLKPEIIEAMGEDKLNALRKKLNDKDNTIEKKLLMSCIFEHMRGDNFVDDISAWNTYAENLDINTLKRHGPVQVTENLDIHTLTQNDSTAVAEEKPNSGFFQTITNFFKSPELTDLQKELLELKKFVLEFQFNTFDEWLTEISINDSLERCLQNIEDCYNKGNKLNESDVVQIKLQFLQNIYRLTAFRTDVMINTLETTSPKKKNSSTSTDTEEVDTASHYQKTFSEALSGEIENNTKLRIDGLTQFRDSLNVQVTAIENTLANSVLTEEIFQTHINPVQRKYKEIKDDEYLKGQRSIIFLLLEKLFNLSFRTHSQQVLDKKIEDVDRLRSISPSKGSN